MFLKKLLFGVDAQDLLEYALLTALVGLVGIGAWALIETRIGLAYGNYDTQTQDLWEPDDPVGTGTP